MSQLEDIEYMFRYLKMLDQTNAKIIQGLGKYDPRNVWLLSKRIGLPPTTVAFRLKKLMKKGLLEVRAKLNSPRLGLMKAVLIAETNHGLSDPLSKAVEDLEYWTYLARCYGKFNGLYAIFSFPFEHRAELEDYFERAKRLGIISDYVLLWTTNIFEEAPSFDWFDFKNKAWNFKWQRWVDEVSSSSKSCPPRLIDPSSYEVEVDLRDLLILKELEKNGLKDFTELAKVVKITPQGVRHRFIQHVQKRNLIVEYEIAVLPYPWQVSDLCAFVFDFPSQAAMAKFSNSLSNKPFVLSYAKVLGKNSLLVNFYIPKTEFSTFLTSLNSLSAQEIIRDFVYVFIDIASFKRQTISYEYFKDGKWIYNHGERVQELDEIVPAKLRASVSRS